MRAPVENTAQQVAEVSPQAARKIIIVGNEAWRGGLSLAARLACIDETVWYLCADNRFDPYAITRLAKIAKVNPTGVLRRIYIARAFTAFQLAELVFRLDPKRLSGLVVISGLCSSFFDEDISLSDAARLFYRVLWRVNTLADNGLRLLITQTDSPQNTRRQYLLNDLCRHAHVLLRMGNERARLKAGTERQPALPFSNATNTASI